jgi:trans-aconitate 2-methyltransferase
MLKKANAEFEGERNVDFVTGDLSTFKLGGGEEGGGKVDLLFSNAVFHWLRSPTRLSTLTRLFSSLSPGSVLAIQVPDNYHKATHRMMRKTALLDSKPWSQYFAGAKIGDLEEKERPDLDPVESSMVWYDKLVPYAKDVRFLIDVYLSGDFVSLLTDSR